MPQRIDSNFSDENARLIEANQLGTPLGIYRLKPGYIRFLRWSGLTLIIIGVVILLLIILGLIDWHQSQTNSYLDFLLTSLLGGLSALVGGLFLLRTETPRARRARIIVGERGILQIKNNRVEAVRWEDILAVRRGFIGPECYIDRREGKTLTLSGFYKDFDEMIAFIRQRSGVA